MAATLLQLKAVNYGYPGDFHLQGVSLALKSGFFSGIIGPNGSGKSTLLKGLAGELKLRPGQVFLNGEDLCQMPARERAQKISVVSQFNIPTRMTVEEYVLMGRIPYRKAFRFFETCRDKELADYYMKLTKIAHLRHKDLSCLSGGEMQLASVAKALTQEPQLLLLDEATSHLDISHQLEVLDLIQECCEERGLTALMVIHDLNLSAEYCHELFLLKAGCLFAEGTPCEVLTYHNIEAVYNTVVIAQENPISHKPNLFLVSKKMLKKGKPSRCK